MNSAFITCVYIFVLDGYWASMAETFGIKEILSHLTRVGGGWGSGAERGAEGVGWNGRWRLLDTGGHWVDVVTCGHRAGGNQRFQSSHLPLRRRRLAVHSWGGWTVSALYSNWNRNRRWKNVWRGRGVEVERKVIRAKTWNTETCRLHPLGQSVKRVIGRTGGCWFHKQVRTRYITHAEMFTQCLKHFTSVYHTISWAYH